MSKNINQVYQSDFSLFPGTAYKGALADGSVQNPISVILEDGAIDFGDAVCGGTEDYHGLPFDGSNLFFKGVRFRNFGRVGVGISDAMANNVPEAGDTLLLIDFGVVWVEASNEVKAGDLACLTAANEWAGGDVAGNFALDGAVFLTSGSAGELVKLKLTGGKRLTAIEAPAGAPLAASPNYILPNEDK